MKKKALLLASLMMFFTLKINAQDERLLLLESFTNTSCGYCGMYNPAMDALIAANPDKIAAIKYHVNWPSDQDPMYLNNTTENNSRTSYYGVTGVPYVVIDGTHFAGGPNQVTQSVVNQLSNIESPMQLRLSWELNDAQNAITVHVMGQVSTDIIGTPKLYVGVIEKEVHFNSAPGSNGERDFYQVMKKLLPSSSGVLLETLAANDYFAYSFTWELANIYDINQLDAIAWVQNQNTKEVYQACKSSPNTEPFFTNDASVNNITNVKGMNCSGIANPMVLLTNYGSSTLTAAELEVLVNGETLKAIGWTGNLATFDAETVDLGEIVFPVEEANALEVKINKVNGGDDDAPSNNIASFNINGTPDIAGKQLKLTIRTDANPGETTWKVTNLGTGEVVLEGGPYDTPNHTYNETLEITGDGCYDFTIFDAGGDGLTGSGIYGLKAGNTNLFSGRQFGSSESNEFSYEVNVDVEENLNGNTSIYPNPTSGLVNIISEGEQSVTIYNVVGQRIFEGFCDGELQIDMKRFGAGIYAVKVGNDTQRVVVK
jgi:hypothetical protein